jgi:hypothetical protein
MLQEAHEMISLHRPSKLFLDDRSEPYPKFVPVKSAYCLWVQGLIRVYRVRPQHVLTYL